MNTIETLKAFERNLNKKIKNPIVLKNYKRLIKLIEENNLTTQLHNHPCTGDRSDYFDVHLDKNIVLLYRKDGNVYTFERIGIHKEVFEDYSSGVMQCVTLG